MIARTVLASLLVSAPACRAAGPVPSAPVRSVPVPSVPIPSAPSSAAPIGTATLLADGTILLQLRAEGPGGLLGDALLRYAPGDPQYALVRNHLPGLRVGETVFVPPFP